MVDNTGVSLSSYSDYPQLRTANFTAKSQNWRWYNDENNVTPTVALAIENSAPINILFNDALKLRITAKETKNISQNNTRFTLQYSESPTFASWVNNVVATSSCTASSTWCYFNGGGTDNAIITTKVLSDAESCIASVGRGCGTHNESPGAKNGFTQLGTSSTEYEFTVVAKAARVSAVYYFRLFDTVQNIPVPLNVGESYPSLVTVGSSLVFLLSGLSSGTTTEGVVLNTSSTPTTIPFGALSFGTDYYAAYRLNVNTNATEGYQVLMYAFQQLVNSYGSPIPAVTGTNASPTGWSTGCSGSAIGCFGYHAGDDSLYAGSARFGANDSFAQLSTTSAQEIMYSSIPTNDTHDIVYKLKVTPEQPAGNYQTTITYIVVPVF